MNQIIAILGCTASGKSALGRMLALQIGGEVLSVDSMKVYRRMDIGTAKPGPTELASIRHHLIDVVEPWESFSAARFVELADGVVSDVHGRGKPVVAVGGTVLYFKCFYEGLFAGPGANPTLRAEIRARAAREGLDALHEELMRVDPVAAARIHRNDLRRIERALEVFVLTGRPISTLQAQWTGTALRRPDWRWVLIGMRRSREETNRRINERVRKMIASGLEGEVRGLLADPRGISSQALQAVGYAEWIEYFAGSRTRDETIELIKIHSRRLAKHQQTWLRRIAAIHWVDLDEDDVVERAFEKIRDLLVSVGI